jgi:hypothetical protein
MPAVGLPAFISIFKHGTKLGQVHYFYWRGRGGYWRRSVFFWR